MAPTRPSAEIFVRLGLPSTSSSRSRSASDRTAPLRGEHAAIGLEAEAAPAGERDALATQCPDGAGGGRSSAQCASRCSSHRPAWRNRCGTAAIAAMSGAGDDASGLSRKSRRVTFHEYQAEKREGEQHRPDARRAQSDIGTDSVRRSSEPARRRSRIANGAAVGRRTSR